MRVLAEDQYNELTEHIKQLEAENQYLKKLLDGAGIPYDQTDNNSEKDEPSVVSIKEEPIDVDCTLPILTSSKTEGVVFQEDHFGSKQRHDITGYNILPRGYCTYRNRSDISICFCDRLSSFLALFL